MCGTLGAEWIPRRRVTHGHTGEACTHVIIYIDNMDLAP